MKTCPDCKETKPLNEFYTTYCKSCNHIRSKNWYAKNRQAKLLSGLRHHYAKKYGIAYERLPIMLKEQDGKCPICNVEMHLDGTKTASQAGVDHCHTTGIVRGLICNLCNAGLGHFRDTPIFLQNAITYLEKNHKDSTT